jgi:hypothetical protein
MTCLDGKNSSNSHDEHDSFPFELIETSPEQVSIMPNLSYDYENESTNLMQPRPAFLSQQSVAVELNKLSDQSLEMNGLLDSTPKLDDLLGYNETWVKNYFPNESVLNDDSTQSKQVDYEPYIDSQLININNNQSLLDMNNNQSILKTQDEQFEMFNAQLETNANTIDNLLSDDTFFSNIEENIKLFEEKGQIGIQNLTNRNY